MEENKPLFWAPIIDVDGLVEITQKILVSERNDARSRGELRKAITRVIENQFDRFAEGLPQNFADLRSKEFIALEEILSEPLLQKEKGVAAESLEEEKAFQAKLFGEQPSIYNGRRIYSPERFEAMIEYIAFAGKNIFQTNLNKLLFYADFWFYYLTKESISGAAYKPLPHGPVNEGYRSVLDSMETRRKLRTIHIRVKGKFARVLRAKKTYRVSDSLLNDKEIRILDWVLDTLGKLSSDEISEISHLEMAYKNTKRGEAISYEFAKFLRILPPTNLLD